MEEPVLWSIGNCPVHQACLVFINQALSYRDPMVGWSFGEQMAGNLYGSVETFVRIGS